MHAVLQHCRQRRGGAREHVVADDHQREAGRREVLLCAGVDQRELRDVDRSAEHVGRGIGDQGHGAGVGHVVELSPEDRVIRRVMQIRSIGIARELVLPWHACEVFRLGRCGDLHGADACGFLHRFLRPRTRHDVVGRTLRAQKIHGNHRELQARPTLQEQHVVALGNPRQHPQIRLAALDDVVKRLRPMADLQDGHSDAWERQQIALRLFEHFDWKDRGTRREIQDTRCRSHV